DPLERDPPEQLPARAEEAAPRALVDLLLDVGEKAQRSRTRQRAERADRPAQPLELGAALDAERQVLIHLGARPLGERPVEVVRKAFLRLPVVHDRVVSDATASSCPGIP